MKNPIHHLDSPFIARLMNKLINHRSFLEMMLIAFIRISCSCYRRAYSFSIELKLTLKLLFEQLKDIRKDVSIPLILMGYLNPIMQYGFENFCMKYNEIGIDGAIIPDLPFKDYLEEYKHIADQYNLKIIMLITPDTSEERIRLIDTHTDGFIYMVSSISTTGAQNSFDEYK